MPTTRGSRPSIYLAAKAPGGRGTAEGAQLLFLFYGGAVVLAAAQILPGIEAGRDTLRGVGVPYEFAAMFSFPPENLITWVVPAFFGDMVHFPYWGRWYLWEMSLFVSVTGFLLAVYAVVFRQGRERFIPAAMAGILLLLAMGSYLPWFGLLHAYLPGFDTFRGVSKFVFQATLFVILLSAMGLDSLIRDGLRKRWQILSALGAAAVLSLIARPGDLAIIPVACRAVAQGFMRWIFNTGQSLSAGRGFRKQPGCREGRRVCRPGPCGPVCHVHRHCHHPVPARLQSLEGIAARRPGRPGALLRRAFRPGHLPACRRLSRGHGGAVPAEAGRSPHPEPLQPESRHVHGVAGRLGLRPVDPPSLRGTHGLYATGRYHADREK